MIGSSVDASVKTTHNYNYSKNSSNSVLIVIVLFGVVFAGYLVYLFRQDHAASPPATSQPTSQTNAVSSTSPKEATETVVESEKSHPAKKKSPTPAMSIPPAMTQSADHGIINNGSNRGTQIVTDDRQWNYGVRTGAPAALWKATTEESTDKVDRFKVTIKLQGPFDRPKFAVMCRYSHCSFDGLGTPGTVSSGGEQGLVTVEFIQPLQMQSKTEVVIFVKSPKYFHNQIEDAVPYAEDLK